MPFGLIDEAREALIEFARFDEFGTNVSVSSLRDSFYDAARCPGAPLAWVPTICATHVTVSALPGHSLWAGGSDMPSQ